MNFEINFKNDKIKCYNIKSNDKKLDEHYICDYDHKKTYNNCLSSGFNRFYFKKIPYFIIEELCHKKTLLSLLPEEIQEKIFNFIAEPYLKFVHVYQTVYMTISHLVVVLKNEEENNSISKRESQIYRASNIPILHWNFDNKEVGWNINIYEKNYLKSNINQIKITFQDELPDIELNNRDIEIL